MKDREVRCIYYDYEGNCLKGIEGTFWDACQTCNKYKPVKGGAPARKNLKRQKMEKIQNRDIKRMLNDYKN